MRSNVIKLALVLAPSAMRGVCLASVVLVVGGTSLEAQAARPSFELSAVLSNMNINLASGRSFEFHVGGASNVRAAIPVSSFISVEPFLGVSYFSAEDYSTFRTHIGIGLPLSVSQSFGREGMFFRPDIAVSFFSVESLGDEGRSTQVDIGGTCGHKIPFGSRVALRLELGLVYAIPNTERSELFSVVPALGISVFF